MQISRLYELAAAAIEQIARQNPLIDLEQLRDQFLEQFDRALRAELAGKSQSEASQSRLELAPDGGDTLYVFGSRRFIRTLEVRNSDGRRIKSHRFQQQSWGAAGLGVLIQPQHLGQWLGEFHIARTVAESEGSTDRTYVGHVRSLLADELIGLIKILPCLEKREWSGEVQYRVKGQVVWRSG